MIQMNDMMKIEDILLTNIEGAQQRGTFQQWPKQSTCGLNCRSYSLRYAAENQLELNNFLLKIYVLPSRPGEGDLYERKQPRKDPWMDPHLGLKKELVFMPIIDDDDSLHYAFNHWSPSNSWTIAASWRTPRLWWWRRSQRQPALSAVGGSSPADYFD